MYVFGYLSALITIEDYGGLPESNTICSEISYSSTFAKTIFAQICAKLVKNWISEAIFTK